MRISKCIACTMCIKQCPVKNIQIVNGKADVIKKQELIEFGIVNKITYEC